MARTMAGKKDRDTDFGAFVKRQQTDERVDWAKERDEWLGHLKELYEQTESFLAKYTGDAGRRACFRMHRVWNVSNSPNTISPPF